MTPASLYIKPHNACDIVCSDLSRVVHILMMAIGYQAEVDILDDDFKEAEVATRSRALLSERFYAGQWGLGIE